MAEKKYSKEDADQLGKSLKRKDDGLGKPLDDKGRRFFGLREDGYKGWIDQDGYPNDRPPLGKKS